MSGPPLRIAHVIQRFLPFVGGAERQLAAVAARLGDRGLECCVFTRRRDHSPAAEIFPGFSVRRLANPGGRVVAAATFTVSAMPAFHNFRPDVIHAHELFSPTTTALAYKKIFGTPVIAKVLRGGSIGDICKLSATYIGRLRLAAIRSQVDAFAVISREIDSELAGIGIPQERRRPVPNGVDTLHFSPATPAQKTMLRERLVQTKAPVALFAGRLEPEKQVDRLIALWPQVREDVPGAVLVIAGEGSMLNSLKRMAPPSVLMVGLQTDMQPWYRAADAFVLASTAEGLSNALLEAMASGLVPVATAVGGAPDLLKNNENGLLVDWQDAGSLKHAIVRALTTGRQQQFLANAARQTVVSSYSLDVTVERLIGLYEYLAAKKRRQDSCRRP
jgi:glycosyltransferase involved in cell wall biosynthesis